jgi:hypothetical protein
MRQDNEALQKLQPTTGWAGDDRPQAYCARPQFEGLNRISMNFQSLLEMALQVLIPLLLAAFATCASAEYKVVCYYTNWAQYRPEGEKEKE